MKKLYILFFLTIGFLTNAQIINFPDANFKAKLLSASASNTIASTEIPDYNPTNADWFVTSYHSIDINNNGEIEQSEAALIKYLDVSYEGGAQISDLTGIAYFTNLIKLDCDGNSLTNLDVSGLNILIILNCRSNQLNILNITGLDDLQALNCSENQLTTIDITQNIELHQFICTGNQLTSIDVSQNFFLHIFYCNGNQLTSIDVTQNIFLQVFDCSNNLLNTIDIAQNTLLWDLKCGHNQLTILDVSQNPDLSIMNCEGTQITSIDLSNNTYLGEIFLNNNSQLSSINVKNGYGSVLWIEFSNCPLLEYICTNEVQLDEIQQKINTYGYAATCHVNSYCSFVPGGAFYEISGNTKLDSNNNGCDVSDINFSNLNFSISDGTNTSSLIANQTGNYSISVQAGNYTITPKLENPSYFTISPTSVIVNFPQETSPFTQDFCVSIIPHSDVEIVIIPTSPARPGFNASYKLVYRNKGNQIENGTVTFSMYNPDVVDFVSSLPNFNSQTITPSIESFTWNYSNLQPFETREIYIVLNINSPMETPPVNGGDLLSFDTQIVTSNTDENLNDNFFAIRQVVVNSYDPNDKTCLQGETIPPSEVGKYVHYVIRFENTGTFPAENIVVKDLIDLAKYDIATLVPLNSSHDFYTRINGNKVEFIFENINLDFNDATNDGYVAFKIKTLPSLVLGDTFTNNANIYFDYNFPITTNTYTTTVAALSTQDFDFGTYFTLYPSPAKDLLNIQAKQGLTVNSIEIYNQLGQIIMAVTNAVNSIDVADLSSGTYFVKINTEKGSTNAKFLKE